MKGFRLFTIFCIALFMQCIACATPTSRLINVKLNGTPVPVQVSVSVNNLNWVETISICNISPNTIPLTNLEFDFNYAITMPNNIWGQPWAAWKVANQTGTAVVLTGGTPYTPPLLPDPNCTHPLTIQFNAAPDAPAPAAPFVFKAEGGQPSGEGALKINLPQAPAANLPNPTVKVAGQNVTQQQTVTWGAAWQLDHLQPGNYTITSTPVDNGTNFYAADAITANVANQQMTNQTLVYKAVPTGNVKITLTNAPNNQVSVNFSGQTYSFTKTVANGLTLSLPTDTYAISALVPGYTVTAMPNPLTVPTQTALTLNFVQNQVSQGPYTTGNGQILDKNNNPVTFQGVSWFGFNTGNHMLHGLWQSDFTTMLGQIKAVGFNAVRIPFQFDFILDSSIKPSGITTSCNGKTCNTDVPQDSALHAFQWIVQKFTDNGLYVLLDDHYEDNLYVTNQAQWVAGWQKIAQLFVNNPMVGYDIYNEPDSHGLTWEGNVSGTAWMTGLTSAMNTIYSVDQHKLFFVEGTAQGALEANWGDGFATDNAAVSQGISNPKNFFTQLATKAYLNQVVVSPHVYGPDGTNNAGPDHSDQSKAFAVWSRLHGYLLNNFMSINNTSQSGFCINQNCHLYPIAIGEFGGKFDPSDPYYTKDVATMINLANFLNRLGSGKPAQPSWFYWDWNPNSGNTGGILKDDWATIDCNKVNYLKNNLGLKPAAGICASK